MVVRGLTGYKFGGLRAPNLHLVRPPITPLTTDLGPYSPTYNAAYILAIAAGLEAHPLLGPLLYPDVQSSRPGGILLPLRPAPKSMVLVSFLGALWPQLDRESFLGT